MSAGRTARLTLGTAIVALALFLLPAVAWAGVVRMDLPALTQAASSIAIVHVTNQTARTEGSSHNGLSAIYTDSTLRVERVLKGSKPDVATLTQLGGTVGGVTLHVAELPTLKPGERCILFLDAAGQVIGGYQGKLAIDGARVPALGMSLSDTVTAILGGGSALAEQPSHDSGLLGSSTGVGTSGAAVAPPSISSITPGDANAGIGTRVTIYGSDFGGSAGSVTFPSGVGGPPISANVVGWSYGAVVCEVPSGAESGISADGVVVTRSDGVGSSPFHYPVGFSYTGARWQSSTITYRVNPNCPGVNSSVALARIKSAMATWNAAGSTFRYVYGGSCSTHTEPVYPDGHNDIYWASGGFAAGVLGYNATWTDGTTIEESDIVMNAQTPYHWAIAAVSNTIDVQTSVTHELGHAQQLGDQYDDNPKVMSALFLGRQRLALSQAEIDGTMYLWGGPTPSITSPTDPDQNAWYKSHSATFNFAATGVVVPDGYSWVLDTSPNTIPSAAPMSSTPTFSSSALVSGDNWFHVRARSIFGIWGPTASYRVRVDGVPPVTTSDALPSYPSTATITLSATDVGSGVARTSYRVDGGAWVDGTQAVVSGLGAHTLDFASVDNFGNAETTHTVAFTTGDGVHLSATSLAAGWGSAASAATLVTVPYAGAASLVGTLSDATGTPMAGEPSALVIAEYFDGSVWRTAGAVSPGPSAGQFSFVAAPRVRTQYRLHFLGDWKNAPTTSDARTVLPAASVGKPSVPKTGKRTRSITVSGVLAPAGAAGSASTVKLSVYQWRRVRGRNRWSLRKTVWTRLYARDAGSSKYAQTFRISSAGKWSVIAVAPTNASTAGASSARSSTITIR